ncbi:MAG TPA: trigger factor [Thermoanaerobaculia bacterium]|jgi:trigger factor|nr:trigger factor [Thermoanaerobaculia bacterium]
MLLNYEDVSPVKKIVEVEIPADLITAESQRVTSEFSRQAKIDGFRPGKVPLGVVRTRFAKEIQEQVMERLLPRTFHEAIADKGVEIVGDPHLQHVDAVIEGAPVKYKAEFEVKPQFELGEYRGLAIDDPKIEVADADVDKMIERLREQASVYRPETERGLEQNDFAMIEMTTSGEGIEPETRGGHFQLGEETPLTELHESLRGKKPGEAASFDKTYPDDAQNENFRGKNIHHEVTLKEIRVQEKPEITDEFAQSTGGWDSVAQMREAITADIRKHREQEVRRMKQGQIGELLLARHEFEVPETLVEEEVGKSLQNYARFLASQGVDIEKAEIDWRKMRDEFLPEAAKRVRRSLILEQIAKKENLIVSDVEVDAEIRRAAKDADRDFAEVRHRLKHDGGYEQLRMSLSQEKALDLVVHEATLRSA